MARQAKTEGGGGPKTGRERAPPKNAKPELKPLDRYLAELLSPAVAREDRKARIQ